MTCVISTAAGINGVRLVHRISKASKVTYFFAVFETNISKERLKKVKKKTTNNSHVLFNVIVFFNKDDHSYTLINSKLEQIPALPGQN